MKSNGEKVKVKLLWGEWMKLWIQLVKGKMADNGKRIWGGTCSLYLVSGWQGLSVKTCDEQRWRTHTWCLKICMCLYEYTCICEFFLFDPPNVLVPTEKSVDIQNVTKLHLYLYQCMCIISHCFWWFCHNLLFSVSSCLAIHVRKKNLGKLLLSFNHKGKKEHSQMLTVNTLC